MARIINGNAYLVTNTEVINKIGFTNEYYTLWKEKIFTLECKETGQWFKEYDLNYRQNLSKDEATALKKAEDMGLIISEVDKYLRGLSSSWKFINYPPETFQFGKYQGCPIVDFMETELNYVLWYGNKMANKTDFKHESEEQGAKHILMILDNSPLVGKYKGKYCDIDYVKARKNEDRRNKARSKKAEYYGEVGERIKKESLKLDKTTSFEGFYGRTYVFTFVKDNYTFVYMGSSRLNVEQGDKVNLAFTIKDHNEYNGLKQTKIARPRIVK